MAIIKLWHDFETYCDLDLELVGLYNYVKHPSFEILCLAWAFNDDEVQIWTKEDNSVPLSLRRGFANPRVKLYAHNAEFEATVQHYHHDQLQISSRANLNRYVDTAALSCTYGYPFKLAAFTSAIGASVIKSSEGTRLINICCKQDKKGRRRTPSTNRGDFNQLYSYCMTDVESMRAATKMLPTEELSPYELQVWMHTVKRNRRGLHMDRSFAEAMLKSMNVYKSKVNSFLPGLTKFKVTKATQVARIKDWCATQGVLIKSLSKDVLPSIIEDPETPIKISQVLQIRLLAGKTSTAKYVYAVNAMNEHDRVQANEVYHKAHTGRFAGRGFQLHNMPRDKDDDPEKAIAMVIAGRASEYNKKVIQLASKLIRPMIKAPEGKRLIVADYKSVENVLTHGFAGDKKTLEDFRKGLDQYKVYATARFKVAYDEVTKEKRQYCKPCVLGLGFGGGWAALVRVAKNHGITLSQVEAQYDVDFYRNKYPMIPVFWRKVIGLAAHAIKTKTPQVLHTCGTKIEFRSAGHYLFIILPSGRRLSYPNVQLEYDGYGRPQISYMGVYKSTAWVRTHTHGGKMVENIVQGAARDLLVHGCMVAEAGGYPLIGTVHDEGITELPHGQGSLQEFGNLMCVKQDWAAQLPIFFDGYEAERYRKD